VTTLGNTLGRLIYEAVEKGVWKFEGTIELRETRAAGEFQTPFSTRC
jgi:hypothetical protein